MRNTRTLVGLPIAAALLCLGALSCGGLAYQPATPPDDADDPPAVLIYRVSAADFEEGDVALIDLLDTDAIYVVDMESPAYRPALIEVRIVDGRRLTLMDFLALHKAFHDEDIEHSAQRYYTLSPAFGGSWEREVTEGLNRVCFEYCVASFHDVQFCFSQCGGEESRSSPRKLGSLLEHLRWLTEVHGEHIRNPRPEPDPVPDFRSNPRPDPRTDPFEGLGGVTGEQVGRGARPDPPDSPLSSSDTGSSGDSTSGDSSSGDSSSGDSSSSSSSSSASGASGAAGGSSSTGSDGSNWY